MIAYPEARSFACPGLRESKPEVGWQRSLEELTGGGLTSAEPPAEWGGAIELCWIRDKVPLPFGAPFFNEVVFCHTPSRTLIVTDLWWNYPATPDVPLSSRLWKAGMDVIYRPVYNRFMRTPSWHPPGLEPRARLRSERRRGRRHLPPYCGALSRRSASPRAPGSAQSYETILGWDFDYIAPCHGEPVAEDGKRVLAAHLALDS